jgi:hypothetical protein
LTNLCNAERDSGEDGHCAQHLRDVGKGFNINWFQL